MNGTMLDTSGFYEEAIRKTTESYGKIYTRDMHMDQLGRPTKAVCETVMSAAGITAPLDEFQKRYQTISYKLIEDNNLKPGVEKLVNYLHAHNIPMAIATSSADSFNIKVKKHKEILDLFHHYVLANDKEVSQGKPQPDIYLVAARRFEENPKPENCLVFEDSPNGVIAATMAGMKCIMIPELPVPEEIKQRALCVLNSLEEFKPEWIGWPPMD